MKRTLTNHILNICSTLNKHSVEYMLVGGTAVAAHGYFRMSSDPYGMRAVKHDLDIWYNPSYENYFRLLDALEDIGLNVIEFKEEQAPEPKKSFFRYDFDELTLDLLPQLKGLSKFASSFKNREIIELEKIEIPVIGFEDLIREKEINARPKDIEDIKQLKAKRRQHD